MSPRVVVVGGGIAGIAAAGRLRRRGGLSDVMILEAKDRLGGRIHTRDNGGGHLEMGAQWIHGEGDNPLYLLAENLGQLYRPPADTRLLDDLFYTQHGRRINQDLADRTADEIDRILDDADEFSRRDVPAPPGVDDSVGKFARERFAEIVADAKESDRAAKRAMFEWRTRYEMSDNASLSLDELSLYAWGQYLEYDGEEDVVLRSGYRPLLDHLLRDLTEADIRLGTEVREVRWAGDPRARLTLTTGETLEADHAIVTCSLGVLKRSAATMFDPPLPEVKLSAIERMGFGTVDKIYLEFESRFWEEDCGSINLAWLEGDTETELELRCLDKEHIQKHGRWYRDVHSFDRVDFHPTVLCGWVAGRAASVMESLSEELVTDVCVELLKKFTGLSSLPEVVQLTRSRWGSDEHVLGSYTYVTAGHTAADCDKLMAPLPSHESPRLLFAGEATERSQFSTAHGAYMSGLREADRIIAHLAKHTTGGVAAPSTDSAP